MVSQETLQHLWHFTTDDLKTNQQGRLSDQQIEAQMRDLALMVKIGLIGIGIVTGIALIIIVIVGEFILVPVLLLVAAVLIGVIFWSRQRAMSDLATGEVRVMTGTFQVERKTTYSATSTQASGKKKKRISYYLHLGDQGFKIRREVFLELEKHAGNEISVYYLERSKRIVSADI